MYQQPTNVQTSFNNLSLGGFNNQPQYPQQQSNPNLYAQQQQFGVYGQQQRAGQYGMMGGYQAQSIPQQNLYGQTYQQPMVQQGQINMGFNQNLGFGGQKPQYQQPASNLFIKI